MKKVNYFSGMRVRPEDLNTEQAYFEERIDTNMSVISNKGVVVDATLPDGTLLKYPYVWSDTKSLGVYGLIAYDEYGECIIVEPNFTKIDSDGDGQHDANYIDELIKKLLDLGCKNVVLTGVSYCEGKTGVVVVENGKYSYYEHEKLSNSCHGTGDIYASAFVGSMLCGKTGIQSAKIAADFTVDAIKETAKDKSQWYGARFEPVLQNLINYLK